MTDSRKGATVAEELHEGIEFGTEIDFSGAGKAYRVWVRRPNLTGGERVCIWAHAFAFDGPLDPMAEELFRALNAWHDGSTPELVRFRLD